MRKKPWRNSEGHTPSSLFCTDAVFTPPNSLNNTDDLCFYLVSVICRLPTPVLPITCSTSEAHAVPRVCQSGAHANYFLKVLKKKKKIHSEQLALRRGACERKWNKVHSNLWQHQWRCSYTWPPVDLREGSEIPPTVNNGRSVQIPS